MFTLHLNFSIQAPGRPVLAPECFAWILDINLPKGPLTKEVDIEAGRIFLERRRVMA